MIQRLIVVDNPATWPLDLPGVEVVAARQYLTDPAYAQATNTKVFNLCRSFRYQSTGYYVSLLAAARKHQVMPSVETLQDLRLAPVTRVTGQQLQDLIDQAFKAIKSDQFELSIYFGKNLTAKYDRLAAQLFASFPAPLLRASFEKTNDQWQLKNIRLIGTRDIPDSHREFVIEQAQRFFTRGVVRKKKAPTYRFDLAILVNPDEKMPPSNEKALLAFEDAAENCGLRPQRITKQDHGRIAEFDALFIRETTSVNHHTFRLARRAEAEGLVVIDDPVSILRCTNKVFLAEALTRHKIPQPKTLIFSRESMHLVAEQIGFPCVVKLPDSSFSVGVQKFKDAQAFEDAAPGMLANTDLLIAQAYLPTDFDWRIGVLNGQPLYACQYFMARGHWQIYHHDAAKQKDQSGDATTMPVHQAPEAIVKAAVKAANLMGQGLYGVDLKEVDGKPIIIEVNDNPSIDHGCEDLILGPQLYQTIMQHFVTQLDARTRKL